MKVVFEEIKVWAWKKSNALSWARDKNRLGERSGEGRVLEGLEVTMLWQAKKEISLLFILCNILLLQNWKCWMGLWLSHVLDFK